MLLRKLGSLLSGKKVEVPDPPGHRSRVSPNEFKEDLPNTQPEESAAWSAFIEYVDTKGEHSARVITLRRLFGQYGEVRTIGAHCHNRNAYRKFNVANITSMACVETGEMLDPVEQCIALHRSGALKIEDIALTRVMRVITFIAKCDGEFHALEREELDDILGRYFRFFGGDDDAYECAIKEAPRLAPMGGDVLKALRWIAKTERKRELSSFVLDATARMIEADGQYRDQEISWALEVSDALKTMAGRA